MNKKILFYVQNDWFLVSHRLPILKEVQKEGYEVHAACRISTFKEKLVSEGIVVHPLKYLGARQINPLQELFALLEIYKLLLKIKPDIVHNISIRPVLLGSIAARICRIPFSVNAVTGVGFVFMSTGKKAFVLQYLVTSVLKFGLAWKNAHLIFQNNDDIDLFRKFGVVNQNSKITLLHGSGVNLETFSPSESKNTPQQIIFGARLLRDKGIRELIKAAYLLNKRGLKFKLLVAGDADLGNPTAIRSDEIESWEKYEFIDVLGHRDDMDELLAKSSIACLPSYREGLPKFLADAAACGLPIVTTNTPGCREVVVDGKNGFLVPVKSIRELADALEKLLVDSSLRTRMGIESRKRAEEFFNIDDIVNAHFELYTMSLK